MNENIEKASDAIEAAIKDCGIAEIAELSHMKQAMRMAQGMRALRTALTEEFMREVIMPLQGSKLGFLTDKDKNKDGTPGPGYPIAVVRDCLIVALIHGFHVVNNEFNIIGGGFYTTQAGYDRKVRQFPGLSHFNEKPGSPQFSSDGKNALVPYAINWRLEGTAMSLDCVYSKEDDQRIPVRVNNGMGSDAVVGKARRKILRRVYETLTGFTLGDGEVGDAETFNTTGEPAPSGPAVLPMGSPEGKRTSLGSKATKSRPAAASESPAAAAASDVPISAPPAKAPVDARNLHDALKQVDAAWRDPGTEKLIESWSEQDRAAALEWAMAVLMDGPMKQQLARPPFTVLAPRIREPGED